LAGFHILNTACSELSKAYKENVGYSELQEEFALQNMVSEQ
jgi:isocitrate lyase